VNLKKYHYLYFFLLFLCGFILRYYALETNGLWIDEIWSMRGAASTNSISKVISIALADTHPPLFDIILHWVLIVFNDNEFAGRYLALFFGLIGMVLTYYYALKLSNNKTIALFAFSIISFNYWHIIYSFEGRFYTFLYLLALINIFELFLYLKNFRKINLISFIIAAILISYTHYYGVILEICLGITVLLLYAKRLITLKNFKTLIVAFLIVLIVFSPCIPYMFAKSGLESWMKEPPIYNFIEYFYLYTGKNPLEFVLLFIPLLLGFKFLKSEKKFLILIYSTALLGFLIPFTISHLSTPMLHSRYTIIYLPAIFLMAVVFWSRLEYISQGWKKGLYLLVILSSTLNIIFLKKDFKSGNKDPWKEVSLFLEKKSTNTVYTEHVNYLDYYSDKKVISSQNILQALNTNSPLWLLITNYDTEDILSSKPIIVLEEHLFHKKFKLLKVQLK